MSKMPIFEWTKSSKECPINKMDEEYNKARNEWIEEQERSIKPPENLHEFKERLFDYMEARFERVFGLEHRISAGKMIRRDMSVAGLVNAEIRMAEIMKAKRKVSYSISTSDAYQFLKIALEQSYPFSRMAQLVLGINIDCAKLKLPEKHRIVCQAVTQILWYLKRGEIPTAEKMGEFLQKQISLVKSPEIIDSFWSKEERTMKKWIRAVCPVPRSLRIGRGGGKNISDSVYNNIVPIPGAFLCNDVVVNFIKLRFIIFSISRILKMFGWSLDQVLNSKILETYVSPLKFYPALYVKDWAKEGFRLNGSIFDL